MTEHWMDRVAKRIAGERKPDPYAGCTKRSGVHKAYAGPRWDCSEQPTRKPIKPDCDLIFSRNGTRVIEDCR